MIFPLSLSPPRIAKFDIWGRWSLHPWAYFLPMDTTKEEKFREQREKRTGDIKENRGEKN